MASIRSVCVFCGSKTGITPDYTETARLLGEELAAARLRLVFGGGHIGLMGVVADAVLANGGEVTGVIPESLRDRELAHPKVDDMRVVDSMHTRKALMAELSDAFVALPGGMGTFEELFEIMTWRQLEFHDKPIVILNIGGYYDHLLTMIDHGISAGFMKEKHRRLFLVAGSVAELMSFLKQSSGGSSDDQAIWEET